MLFANIFSKIFDYIEPASRALQDYNMDLIMATDLLKKHKKTLNLFEMIKCS